MFELLVRGGEENESGGDGEKSIKGE